MGPTDQYNLKPYEFVAWLHPKEIDIAPTNQV